MSRYFLNIGCELQQYNNSWQLRCDIIGTSSLKKDMFLCFWPFAHQCLSMGIPRNFGTWYLHVLVAPFHARLLDEFTYTSHDLPPEIFISWWPSKTSSFVINHLFLGGRRRKYVSYVEFVVIIHFFPKRWSTDWRPDDSYHLVIKGGWKMPIKWRFFIGTSFTYIPSGNLT